MIQYLKTVTLLVDSIFWECTYIDMYEYILSEPMIDVIHDNFLNAFRNFLHYKIFSERLRNQRQT